MSTIYVIMKIMSVIAARRTAVPETVRGTGPAHRAPKRAGPDNSEPALSRLTWESQSYLSFSASIMGTAASQSIFQPIDTRTVSPVAGAVANSV